MNHPLVIALLASGALGALAWAIRLLAKPLPEKHYCQWSLDDWGTNCNRPAANEVTFGGSWGEFDLWCCAFHTPIARDYARTMFP